VWFASLEEIANHVKQARASGAYDMRVDKLPYYDKPQVPDPPPSSMLKGGH
jgi:hypothetical protein